MSLMPDEPVDRKPDVEVSLSPTDRRTILGKAIPEKGQSTTIHSFYELPGGELLMGSRLYSDFTAPDFRFSIYGARLRRDEYFVGTVTGRYDIGVGIEISPSEAAQVDTVIRQLLAARLLGPVEYQHLLTRILERRAEPEKPADV